jgi:hypothetical protein
VNRPCEFFLVICPDARRKVSPSDETCDVRARMTLEVPCSCSTGVHITHLCPDHYDWLTDIFERYERMLKEMKENL